MTLRPKIAVSQIRGLIATIIALAVIQPSAGRHLNNAETTITGTVQTLDSRGVSGVRLVLVLPSGEQRYTQTNPFGNFRFDRVPAGQSVTITPTKKRMRFDSQTVTPTGPVEMSFIALAERTMFALDTSFGVGGKVTTDFGANDRAYVILPQQDGRFVVVGSSNLRPAIARYHADGSLDMSFGSGGKIVSQNLTTAIDLNVKPGALSLDNKVLVGGRTANFDFAIERRLSSGDVDPRFGTDGLVTLDFSSGSVDEVKALAVQSDGKIVVVGTILVGGSDRAIGVVRLLEDGSIDTSFGTDGRAVANTQNLDDPRAVSLQKDGKIVICGIQQNSRQMVVRFNTNGTLDTGFGINGIAVATRVNLQGYDLAIQRNGKISGIGEGLARYNADGTLDDAFNGPTGGFGVPSVELQAIATRSDGLIVVAGRSFQFGPGGGDFGVALIHPFTGQILSRIETDILSQRFEDPKDIQMLGDDTILVAGYVVPSSLSDFAIVKYVNF